MRTDHILIFDDDIDMAELLVALLEAKGYPSQIIRHKKELIAYLKTNPDSNSLLLDVFIGDISGLAIAADVKRDFPKTRILLMSGSDAMQIHGVNTLIKEGVIAGFINKPFSFNHLLHFFSAV